MLNKSHKQTNKLPALYRRGGIFKVSVDFSVREYENKGKIKCLTNTLNFKFVFINCRIISEWRPACSKSVSLRNYDIIKEHL